jgi:two-component system, OmpR family, phosphate regulon response regulator PhoB
VGILDMKAKRILIVDDERAIRDMIAFGLLRAGFEVQQAPDAEAALTRMAESRFDLLLVDWMLPGMNGLDLLVLLRKSTAHQGIPVMMLTARIAENDKVAALDHGADDYLTKPFALQELLARVRAVLRRHERLELSERSIIEAGGLSLDVGNQQVTIDGRIVALRPAEYRLLSFLMSHPEKVYSREQLLSVQGEGERKLRNVDVQVRRLRHALEQAFCDRFIQTVHSAGYRFSTRGH